MKLENEKSLIDTLCENIKYIDNISDEAIKYAISKYSYAIKYVENPSYEQMRFSVSQYGSSIRYIKNPPIDLCRLAIEKNHLSFYHIKNKNYEITKFAVGVDGNNIKYAPYQTTELQLLAMDTKKSCLHEYVIKSLFDMSDEVIKHIVDNFLDNSDIILELLKKQQGIPSPVQCKIINKYPHFYHLIKNPSKSAKTMQALLS